MDFSGTAKGLKAQWVEVRLRCWKRKSDSEKSVVPCAVMIAASVEVVRAEPRRDIASRNLGLNTTDVAFLVRNEQRLK